MNGAAGAAAAAIANAIKASGAIVQVDTNDFTMILSKADKPIVIIAESHFLKTSYKYLTSYKGFVFFTKTSNPLSLPGDTELIAAKSIWIPQ